MRILPRTARRLPFLLLASSVLTAPAFAEDLVSGARLSQWWATEKIELSRDDGRLCATIPGGTANRWDRIIGLPDVAISKGETYRLAVTGSGTPSDAASVIVQEGREPWTPYATLTLRPQSDPGTAEMVFTSPVSARDALLVIQLGGSQADREICVSSLVLEAGATPAATPAAAGSGGVQVNQAGYLPDGPKRATLVSDEKGAVAWELLDESGKPVFKGKSKPLGPDAASGVSAHLIDFSKYTSAGKGFRLSAGGAQSHPFDIDAGLYERMRADALSFYYPMRSGIAIDGGVAGKAYARPAGHVGKLPNKGDTAVACLSAKSARKIYGESWSCDYQLDVTGGWYDAGDHGKYVVNGGISAAQVMATYERALHHGGKGSPARADDLSRIPERGNGVPDILDEARWELDFLMKMQVPDGETHAGMAHHSIHDVRWTVPPMLPHEDPEERALYRPSTAATLNLAAAAAQGARLFRDVDPAYAGMLLAAATRAYEAAEREPGLMMPQTDGSDGGGSYADDDVEDEFFWAAAELFITTGEAAYLDRVKASAYFSAKPFDEYSFNWRNVSGLARVHLATVPSALPAADLKAMQKAVVASAEALVGAQKREAFGILYAPPGGRYAWGSNHSVLQNAVIVAAAYDLTGKGKYLAAVRETMDYLLGRNPLGTSYVTGYGAVYTKNQHSRWFANAVDPSLPNPPPGTLSGGPNSDLSDPISAEKLKGCAPQACHVDDIGAYATNELTINWNAPLAWVASFLADTK